MEDPVKLAALSDFVLERLRAGDELTDGIVLRAREISRLPERPVWSGARSIEEAKDDWRSRPVAARRDETGADWARMLRELPRARVRTDLANLRVPTKRPRYISLLTLLRPLPAEVRVGDGDFEPRPAEAGAPNARAAGVAALRIYRNFVTRFAFALPSDVSMVASEMVRQLLGDELVDATVGYASEEKAEAKMIESFRARVAPEVAMRVFAKHAAGEAPELSDVATLFARPSAAYKRAFDGALRVGENLTGIEAARIARLRAVYVRGGAFSDPFPRLTEAPTPKPVALVNARPAAPKGERTFDVGLNSKVPIIVEAVVSFAPRSATAFKVALVRDGVIVKAIDRSAGASRSFRWTQEPKGGRYRVEISALDRFGEIVGEGVGRVLRVRQFAHCVRCAERIDFSEVRDERECTWITSPRPATRPVKVDDDDFEYLARHGENERVRAAAESALREGRVSGRLSVLGEPAAPAIEYVGAHSAASRLPDLPRVDATGAFVRGSLVADFADEMRDLETRATLDETLSSEKARIVEALTLRLRGLDESESDESVRARTDEAYVAITREADLALGAWKRDVDEGWGVLARVLFDDDDKSARPKDLRFADDYDAIVAAHATLADTDDALAKISRSDDLDDFDRAPELIADAKAALQTLVKIMRRIGGAIRHEDAKLLDIARRMRAIAVSDAVTREKSDQLNAFAAKLEDEIATIFVGKSAEKVREIVSVGSIARLDREVYEKVMEGVIADIAARKREIEKAGRTRVSAEAWEIAANAIVAEIESARLEEPALERVKNAPRDVSPNIVVKAEIATDETRMREINESFDRLAIQIAHIPSGVSDDLIARAREMVGERDQKIAPWEDSVRDAKQFRDAWDASVEPYVRLGAIARADAKRARDLLIELADPDLDESDLDEKSAEIDALTERRVTLVEASERAEKVLGLLGKKPTLPDSKVQALVEALFRARDRLDEQAEERTRRARETEEEARDRARTEFTAAALEFDAVARSAHDARNAFARRRDPNTVGLATLIEMVRKIDEVSSAFGDLESRYAADDRVNDLLAARDSERDELHEVLLSDDWISAASNMILRAKTEQTAIFGQRTVPALHKALGKRLVAIDETVEVLTATAQAIERAIASGESQRADEMTRFEKALDEMRAHRDAVAIGGAGAESRLRIAEMFAAFKGGIDEASAEIATEAATPGDLGEAIAGWKELVARRSSHSSQLSTASSAIATAGDEHAQTYEDDAKIATVLETTKDAVDLLARYEKAEEQDRLRRRDALYEKIKTRVDLAEALAAIDELPRDDALDLIRRGIEKKIGGAIGAFETRIEDVQLPTSLELERDRDAGRATGEAISGLRAEIIGGDASIESAREKLLETLDETESELGRRLRPARASAEDAIARAYQMALYGGAGDREQVARAFDFLERDRERYGSLAEDATWAPESRSALEAGLSQRLGKRLTPERCSPGAYVQAHDAACSLDTIVMLAAKADPLIMGRLIGRRSEDACLADFSRILYAMDGALTKGNAPSQRCSELRDVLATCDDPTLQPLLWRTERRRHGMSEAVAQAQLDVAELLRWLNSKYGIEPSQITSRELVTPEGISNTTGKPFEPRVESMQHDWPYQFPEHVWDEVDALHEMQIDEPAGPRSFAFYSGYGSFARIRKTLAREFVRWGGLYRLVAIVNYAAAPASEGRETGDFGHYWLSFLCGDAINWWTYDGTRKPAISALGDFDGAKLLRTAHVIFYARVREVGSASGVMDV